jgi:hypothetical protein
VCWPDQLRRGRFQVVGVLALDEPGRPRRVLSLGETAGDKGTNLLVALSGYTGPRAACRSGYACGADETHLLQRGDP